MLGRFLEYSTAARPLAASFEFYRELGFVSVPVGDQLPEPYLAMFDGAIAIGLHELVESEPWLTFVRPDLRHYVRGLQRLDVGLDYARLGDGEFNSVGFTDPAGQAIALLEARTFPPPEWAPRNVAACGDFFEVSLPAHDVEKSSRFWEALGFARAAEGDSPHPWRRLAGHGVTLGLHEVHCRPGVSFRCSDLDARCEYLRAKGMTPRIGSPLADRAQAAATLTAPDGTHLYLLEKGAQ